MISPGRRYIFVHIPKTGGTAMTLALEARARRDDIPIGDTPKAKRRKHRLAGIETAGRLWKHSRLNDIVGLVPAAALDDYFVFTLVRNPWDRLVGYYHWLRDQRFSHRAVTLARTLDFEAFLDHPETRAALAAHPYDSYVRAPDGRLRCDAFVRLEALEEDLAPVEAHLGFRLSPLPVANRSDRARDYRRYYSDKAANTVQELCAPDITGFKYRF